MLLAAVIAALPCYGYAVHASRDNQVIGLAIVLCWVLTCVATVGLVAWVAVRPPAVPRCRRVLRITSAGFVVATAIGWGGVRAAFFELIAG